MLIALMALADDPRESFGDIGDIPFIKSRYADTTVLGHIYPVFVSQMIDVGRSETGDAEHSRLLFQERPVQIRKGVLEFLRESCSDGAEPKLHLA